MAFKQCWKCHKIIEYFSPCSDCEPEKYIEYKKEMEKQKEIKSKKEYRFKSNPQEKVFFDMWCEFNNSNSRKYSLLEYLLAENPNRPNGECTKRDEDVASIVIQWLGSPVGQGFLSDCGFIKKE